MKRLRNTRSGNEISFRPKFKRQTGRHEEHRNLSFLKRVYGKLRIGRKKGRGRSTHYSRGRGCVHKTLHQFAQRVVVKVRIVRSNGGSLRKHLGYIERRGVQVEGEKGRVLCDSGYLSSEDRRNWLKEAETDRHHFRLIVSPEQAKELDLEQFARQFAAGLERDLETKLKWVSVVHTNTDNPHVHFIIRGVTESGDDLVISRQYISNGMRLLASQLATRELGYRREAELVKERKATVLLERFTWLDRKLLQCGEIVDCREKTWGKLLLIGRLQFLKGRGLASEVRLGEWTVDADLEVKLRELGKRGDIITRMHEISGQRVESGKLKEGEVVVGTVLATGVYDELSARKQIVIECDDGKVRSVVLAEGRGSGIKKGSVVTITRNERPQRGAFRGLLFGEEGAWVNVQAREGEEIQRRVVRVATELEWEKEEEINQRRKAAQLREAERVTPGFLRRVKDKGRER